MELEQEVKIIGYDLSKIETYLKNNGGIYLGREKQINTLINSSIHPIDESIGYFRIRKTEFLDQGLENISLTFKERIVNKNLRKSIEHTIEIENEETVKNILKLLGYDIFESTVKYRVSYRYKNARFDFDTHENSVLPYPYLEIEVKNEKDLKDILEELQIDEKYVSRLSIKQLIEKLKN